MAIDLNSGTGLFDMLGSVAQTVKNIETNYQAMIETRLEDLMVETPATQQRASAALMGRVDEFKALAMPALEALFGTSREITIRLADDDDPLTVKDITRAIETLHDQMIASADGLVHTLAGSTEAANAANTGDGEIVVGLQDVEGEPLHHVFSESLKLTCIEDGQEGSNRNPGSELFSVNGEEFLARSHPDWPGGSGPGNSMTTARSEDDAKNELGQNILTNSDFEVFTTGLPDSWLQVTGAAQTNFDETATAYRGSKALSMTGDVGGTLTEIKQLLGDTTGTARTLRPLTVYAMGFWMRWDTASAVTAGVLRVQLQETGGSVISITPTHPASAINARITVDLTAGETVTYAFKSAVFITPAVIPSSVELAIEFTTALDNTRAIFIDQVIVQRMTQAYTSGPYVALFRGATDFVIEDEFIATVVNNDDTTNLSFMMNRQLGLQELGVTIPTLAAPTISDGLIT